MQPLDELMKTPRMDVGGADPHNMLAGLKDMLDRLCRLRVPYRMVEIGCFHGVSTDFFCRSIPFVVAIDPWSGADDTYQGFLKRCGEYVPGRLTVVRDASPRALDSYRADAFDFAYIDGDHSFDAVVGDIRACARVVNTGLFREAPRGYICGHDFHMPQVAKAIRLLLGEPEIFSDGSWLCPNQLLASNPHAAP